MAKLLDVFRANSLEALRGFAKRPDQLAIVERDIPEGADVFFQKLMTEPFGILGKVDKETALTDLKDILEDVIPEAIRHDPFYEYWLGDMALICATFCEIQTSDAATFWLGSQRGCRRYHIDNVPLRMLVTYAGKGTEWLPDEAADRHAFVNGEPNEKIIKDSNARQFINQWDAAIFRGGPKGLLHRTPDAALNGPSILMRLDHPSFLKNVIKQQSKIELSSQ